MSFNIKIENDFRKKEGFGWAWYEFKVHCARCLVYGNLRDFVMTVTKTQVRFDKPCSECGKNLRIVFKKEK